MVMVGENLVDGPFTDRRQNISDSVMHDARGGKHEEHSTHRHHQLASPPLCIALQLVAPPKRKVLSHLNTTTDKLVVAKMA